MNCPKCSAPCTKNTLVTCCIYCEQCAQWRSILDHGTCEICSVVLGHPSYVQRNIRRCPVHQTCITDGCTNFAEKPIYRYCENHTPCSHEGCNSYIAPPSSTCSRHKCAQCNRTYGWSICKLYEFVHCHYCGMNPRKIIICTLEKKITLWSSHCQYPGCIYDSLPGEQVCYEHLDIPLSDWKPFAEYLAANPTHKIYAFCSSHRLASICEWPTCWQVSYDYCSAHRCSKQCTYSKLCIHNMNQYIVVNYLAVIPRDIVYMIWKYFHPTPN